MSLPERESAKIRADVDSSRPGFGAVAVEVTIGATTWRTSVFPDSKRGTYVLPVKQSVRRAEGVEVGDRVRVQLYVSE